MRCVDALHFSVRNGLKSEDFFDHFRLGELNGKLPYVRFDWWSSRWQRLGQRGGKECSQLRQPADGLMRITLRVHVCNHQAYERNLWWAQWPFIQIWWVSGGQTEGAGGYFRPRERISADRTRRPSTCECTRYSCTHTVLALRLEKRPDRDYLRWWQRMEMHTRHMHIMVQLLASLLSNANDGILYKGWSLRTIHMCSYDAQLKSAQAYCLILVFNTSTRRIFLRCLHRSKYEQPMMVPVQMDTIDGHSNKGRWLHTPHFCILHAYVSSGYACASILFPNHQRWTRIWSLPVLHLWSTMDGAQRYYNGTLQMVPHLHSMGRVRKHPDWKIWEFLLGPDFLRISCPSSTKILIRKYFSKLFRCNGQKVH